MRKFFTILLAVLAVSCARYRYETVKGDPLGTKIYNLDNGLKVYMSVNKETPRLQTIIAVRVGGKNDPADNTGLAHYLEHIMFKGTESFGTSDYAAEAPLLEQIRQLYDVYRTKTDPAEREAIYHRIDSVSYEASKIAIPNEYDKLMSLIGSKGTNAFTSNDLTCYVEDIPSNRIDLWARVQADRFRNLVVRGFHTELEAVYEEYNMGLTDDMERAMDTVDSILFPRHPYGHQTVIGTQQHLKNPDISAILRQKAAWYVPNNIAICVSGDFDPDEFVCTIEKYFGDWAPNPDIPQLEIPEEEPIASPVEKHLQGSEAEFVALAWRFPGARFPESEACEVVGALLYNGMAGLLDLDINQQQKALAAYCFPYDRTDHGVFYLEGLPQEGQSLGEVRDLLLAEVEKVRTGAFDAALLDAIIANYRLDQMKSMENNRARAMRYVYSFAAGHAWKDDVRQLDRLAALTKDDVVAWAQKWLDPNACAIIYKHIGPNPMLGKIEAPKITPIETNRDRQSAFLSEAQAEQAAPIEPVFTDFSRDMSVFRTQGLEVLYRRNELNGLAEVQLLFDKGLLDDPALELALTYAGYLGTPTRSAEDIANQMYALACHFDMSVSEDRITIRLGGLDENIGQALDIVSDLVCHAVGDEDVLASLKSDALKARADRKLSQDACFDALNTYLTYGPEYVRRTVLPNAALSALTSEELLDKVHSLFGFDHKVLYYGPSAEDGVVTLLAEHHACGDGLRKLERSFAVPVQTPKAQVYLLQYEARQFNYIQRSNRGETFSAADEPGIALFNEYYGGGMNNIVFQEMREARALAYSAAARLVSPFRRDGSYSFFAYIGSQNDKLRKAVDGFEEIIETLPESEKSLDVAKTALDARLRTERTTGIRVLYSYLALQDLGLSEPQEKAVFAALPSMTMADLLATHAKWIQGRTYVYGIVGDVSDLDMGFLKGLGAVNVLSAEEVFGY